MLTMLRHPAGYKLANQGVDSHSLQQYLLGHKNNQHTVRYSELAADRFRDFWRDRRADPSARAEVADRHGVTTRKPPQRNAHGGDGETRGNPGFFYA